MIEKTKKSNMRKKEQGITLVALVITIIIIIILATVTINMAFGDNGLIRQAELARDLTANSTKYEEDSTANLIAYMNGVMGEEGEISEPEMPADGSYSEEKGLNTPNLGSNMELVVFDDETDTWVIDETNSGYSYVEQTGTTENGGTSEWANAKVTTQVDGENVESYFVWIPRYAYRITYYTNEDKTEVSNTPTTYGIIDIKFIKGTGTEAADGTICKYADDSTLDTATDYIIHPAFTTNADLGGGWDSELAGIWIGKYEASSVEGNGESEEEDNVTIKHVKVQPGVSSWRYITIGNCYTVSQNYAPDLNSHMLKNSEWGAVAYLTESAYGRNGTEIGFNDDGFITGGGQDNAYATTNQNQSTTGNVYGIYDMRGGANERVASYYNGSSLLSNGSSFASINGQSDEFVTVYTGIDESTAYKYGDATYETSGWNSDNADFMDLEEPFFNRGGYWGSDTPYTGIFYYDNYNGGATYGDSFRLALVL